MDKKKSMEPSYQLLSEKSMKYYEDRKAQGANIYIDSLSYEEFMLLGEKEMGQRFTDLDEEMQKEKVQQEMGRELEYQEPAEDTGEGIEKEMELGKVHKRKAFAGEDSIANRILHWNYSSKQKEALKAAMKAGVPKPEILAVFYPEIEAAHMQERWTAFFDF